MSILYTSVPSKRLAQSITASSTSFKLSDILGWNGSALTASDFGTQIYAIFRDVNSTVMEIMEIDGTTIASSSITITRRGLNFTGDLTTELAARKLTWVRGTTIVELGSPSPQLFQFLKSYIDGIAIAGSPNSTTTTKGIGRVSVAPASATTPIFVGDNDTRVPTVSGAAFVNATTGMVSMFAGTSVPTGFLACDGSAVSRTTHASLFTAIGTSWGSGDGSTTFNVPDLRGCVPVGAGTKTKVATFASRSGNVITVTGLTNAANNEFQKGQAVLYSAPSGAMTGLTHNTTYYLIRTGNLTFSLATTPANAQNGTVIALSSDGTGTQTFTLTLTARTLGQTGGEENHAMSLTELPSHTHPKTYNTSGGSSGSNEMSAVAGYTSVSYAAAYNTPHSFPTAFAQGDNVAMNNMQPFGVITYIIKT